MMISSELPEILGMSDRIAVMHAGTHSRRRSTRGEATQDAILALALERCAMLRYRIAGMVSVAIDHRGAASCRAGRAPRPDFSAARTSRDLLLGNLPVLIVALGMTLVILTGEIDISVGSLFAICGVVAGCSRKAGLPMPWHRRCCRAGGAVLGALNGALSPTPRIPSIVVTLATMVALRDGLRWATEGAWVQDLPADFQWLGLSQAAYPFVAGARGGGVAVIAVLGPAPHRRRPRRLRDRLEPGCGAAGRHRHARS